MTNEEQENSDKPKKSSFICMYLPCPLVKQKKMQMQICYSLAVTGTMNYVKQKIDKHIENNVFSCAGHTFTRTPQWKYCPTIHHYLFLYSTHWDSYSNYIVVDNSNFYCSLFFILQESLDQLMKGLFWNVLCVALQHSPMSVLLDMS